MKNLAGAYVRDRTLSTMPFRGCISQKPFLKLPC